MTDSINSSQTSNTSIRIRVGMFSLLGLLLIGAMTVFVNDKPYWWRNCQMVHINVQDATGLKAKSAVRSLGLEIGYLKTIELTETYVRLGICITAPVDVLPTTHAFIRGEGFLGDKFVELKPVKYTGPHPADDPQRDTWLKPEINPSPANTVSMLQKVVTTFWIPEAYAQDEVPVTQGKRRKGDIPVGEKNQDVQAVVEQVNTLVKEMTSLTTNLKQAINPQELRQTMTQLNHTLENASKTLAPEGGLNTTAQRTLAKLEDAIEQLRDMLTRVNRGEGSVGMLLNDPSYAEEIHEAIKNVNRLLSRVGGVRFLVDVGGEELPHYNGGRAWFRLGIFPQPDRYYLLGISVDPRGKRSVTTTTTTSGGVSTTTETVQVEQRGLLLTGMLGKIFYNRLDLSIGALHGDGTLSVNLLIGPREMEDMLAVRNDLYSRGQDTGVDDRLSFVLRPFPWKTSKPFNNLYLKAGYESLRKADGAMGFFYGAGLTFDDEDIKLLFALR